ncbi:MAG: hypothetical protein IPK82_38340 [Polyangiaceae bacterium]|nr:hypothetical protein [Polyangiaceae bacterium]
MGNQSRTAWKIVEWNQAQGQGLVECEAFGRLPFDAAAALVRDFHVGESVHVNLEKHGTSFTVSRFGRH